MNRVVCVGPTLHGLSIEPRDGLLFHPPLARGDLLRLVELGAKAILIIDGFFGDRPSVGHKEILFALSRGVFVMGSASLGALRAAECAAFGMVGVGGIFEEYKELRRVCDADVAVAHAPEALSWRPLSIAMVDIEATLSRLTSKFETNQIDKLTHAARALHFTQRQWPEIIARAGLGEGLVHVLHEHEVSRKRIDAVKAIEVFKGHLLAPASMNFEMTRPFAADMKRYAPGLARDIIL
ncbi:MAG: TfuA-like protein [Paracoccaceae bacterium]